jgi:hypothetical protein
LANHLRESAIPLHGTEPVAPSEPKNVRRKRRLQKLAALRLARTDERLRGLPLPNLLGVLQQFALPRKKQFGKGVGPQTVGLSADDEAELVRDILGGHAASAVGKSMRDASKDRQEYFATACGQGTVEKSSPERARAGDGTLDACQPQLSSAEPSDTAYGAMASAPSPQRPASPRQR